MLTKSKSRTTTESSSETTVAPDRDRLVARRLPTHRPPTHPGEMLLEEFLKPLGISQSAFAIRLGVSFPRINEIIRGRRSVTPDTALRLARTVPSKFLEISMNSVITRSEGVLPVHGGISLG